MREYNTAIPPTTHNPQPNPPPTTHPPLPCLPHQVGVVRRDGVYRVLDKGRLAPAVVASAAIPILFANIDIDGRWCRWCGVWVVWSVGGKQWGWCAVGVAVHILLHLGCLTRDSYAHVRVHVWVHATFAMETTCVQQVHNRCAHAAKTPSTHNRNITLIPHTLGTPGGPFKDGGGTDRIGLTGWRARRRNQGRGMATTVAPPPAVVHLIRRSSPFSGADDVQATGERRVTVVRSPKSGVSLWSLGDVGGQYEAARERAMPAAYAVMERQGAREPAGG